MSSHFRLLSAFLTKIFAHFGHLSICLYTTEPKCRKMSVWMDALPKPHILGMGRVPIIRSRRAHKMTVMTLEDHSSKSWSHHRCHARRIRRKYPPHCLPISTSSCLASSDSSVFPSSVFSFSSFSFVFELLDNPGLLIHAGSLLSFTYTIRHISVGALLCLQRRLFETLCWPHLDHGADVPLVADACFTLARVLRLDLNMELVPRLLHP